jgi:hypothetical protein
MILIAIIVLVQFCVDTARGQNTARPNVLIIYADQHRFDCLVAMGNPDLWPKQSLHPAAGDADLCQYPPQRRL